MDSRLSIDVCLNICTSSVDIEKPSFDRWLISHSNPKDLSESTSIPIVIRAIDEWGQDASVIDWQILNLPNPDDIAWNVWRFFGTSAFP